MENQSRRIRDLQLYLENTVLFPSLILFSLGGIRAYRFTRALYNYKNTASQDLYTCAI